MSDSAAGNAEQTPAPAKAELTEIEVFYRKIAAVVVAILAVLSVIYVVVSNEIDTLTDKFQTQLAQYQTQLNALQGGPKFWANIEAKLYQYADAPDMPPERKAKIVAAIKKAADKNRAFIDALTSK